MPEAHVPADQRLVPPWMISSKTIRSFSALYDIGPAPPYSVASMTGSSVSSTSKISAEAFAGFFLPSTSESPGSYAIDRFRIEPW